MNGKLLTGQIRYQNGRRVRITLYKATSGYFKDADGFKWCAQTGQRLDLKPQSQARGTTAYWRDRAGQPLARLVLATVKPLPGAGPSAMKRFSHVAYLHGQYQATRRPLMRIRETKLFWIDEEGFKYRKTDLGCVNPDHPQRFIQSSTIKLLGRHPNGLIMSNEGQDV